MRGSAAFRTGVAPGGVLAGPWTRNPLWASARAVPSLDLRFADNKSLTDATTGQNLVTFTRASSGTYVGSDGVLRTAVNDAPRFDHNPTTGESLGLLVEEQRTNSIRNNTMVGAVAGTPGTLPTNWLWNTAGGASTEVVGTGTENGITYVDVRLFGTLTSSPSIQFDANTAIAAATGQTWTESFYCKVISLASGTPDPRLRIVERSGAGTYLTEGNQPFTPGISSASLAASRFTFTRTLVNASTGCAVAAILLGQSSGAIDITLRIGLPQLEQGAFATSVIPTTTTALTRSADVASITGSNFSSWYRQDEGTVYLQGITAPVVSRFPSEWSLNDGTTNNRIESYNFTSGYYATVRKTGEVSTDPALLSITPASGTAYQKAVAIKSGDYRVAAQGQQAASLNPAFIPSVNELRIGANQSGGGVHNSTIRRLCYWPQRLPNSTLQTITQ